MKQFYFPPEIWTIIYEYDNTYKKVYDQCMTEMNSYFIHNKMISIMRSCFFYYDKCYLRGRDANDSKTMSCLRYLMILKMDTRTCVYRDSNVIVNHKNCWQHYIVKSKERVYTKLKRNKVIYV